MQRTVYIETSFISACVTTRTDPASIYRRETSLEWWQKFRPGYECFVSREVLTELAHPAHLDADEAIRFVKGLTSLPVNEYVTGCAVIFVREKVMPGPAEAGDALHVALATVHRVDYLLSWNVQHLANPNKLDHLLKVCTRNGLTPPRIVTPELLWSHANE